MLIYCALVLCVGGFGDVYGQYTVPEADLWNHLMTSTNYNTFTRPVIDDPNKQINVEFFFSLARLESLNEKTQVMTTFGWMGMLWKDELLRWDPAAFNGLWRLIVPSSHIWLPEIAMLNSVEQGNDLSMDSKFRATIYADGTVQWAPGFKWQTSCTVDLISFPYDTQTCMVTFVNWVYQADLLNFTIANDNPIVDVNNYEENGEWELVSANITRQDMTPQEGFHIPAMSFTLKLKRKPAFFETNVVLPSLIMTAMSALVFYLPAESGEKIGLGITVLLSYSVVLLMVSDITPRSNSMPLISIFIVLSMGLTALSLVGTIIVLNIFHHRPEKPVPRWVQSVMLRGVARLLCMASKKDTGITQVEPALDQKTSFVPQNERHLQKTNEYETKILGAHAMDLPPEMKEFFQNLKEKHEESERLELIRSEWQRVSLVLDRSFFVIFILILIVIGITFVSMIIGG